MNWKKITNDLYEKIKPIGGNLKSGIGIDFIDSKNLETLLIEFDMNEFIYTDPFYGEQKSTAPFRMVVDLFEVEDEDRLKIEHIQELENSSIKDSPKNLKGAFSNSLHFSAPLIKFGSIYEKTIEFEMEYCLTNSDSYGMMTGTIDEHLQLKGRIKTKLKIDDMLIIVRKDQDVKELLEHMNPKIYDLKSIRLATDTGITYRDYIEYRISYKHPMS